jgi:acyl-CoA thioesterase I
MVSESTQTGKVILAIGDSLTAGLGLPPDQAYPAQLEAKLQSLGYNYTVQNAWISGDTSAWVLARLDWLLDGPTPDLVILCIGANDAFQWKNVADIEKNIRAIIERLQSKNIPILLAGMKAPFNLGAEYRKQYDGLFEKLAKEYDLAYMDFFLDGVALKADLNQDDRIHPTRAWYAIVVENLMKVLEGEELIVK